MFCAAFSGIVPRRARQLLERHRKDCLHPRESTSELTKGFGFDGEVGNHIAYWACWSHRFLASQVSNNSFTLRPAAARHALPHTLGKNCVTVLLSSSIFRPRLAVQAAVADARAKERHAQPVSAIMCKSKRCSRFSNEIRD